MWVEYVSLLYIHVGLVNTDSFLQISGGITTHTIASWCSIVNYIKQYTTFFKFDCAHACNYCEQFVHIPMRPIPCLYFHAQTEELRP